jgi:LPXTG-motif cell wall-anchored protein
MEEKKMIIFIMVGVGAVLAAVILWLISTKKKK